MTRHGTPIAAALTVLMSAVFGGLESWAAQPPRPTITVVVYNYAGISPKALGDAKRVAGRVLRQAGIEARWRYAPIGQIGRRRHASSTEIFGPTTLVLRLLPGEMTKRLGFPSDQYGFALSTADGGFPFVAGVFCQRAELLAQGVPSLVPIILGHLVVHEIGHLLLGPQGHSSQGIMRTPWGKAELQVARRGGLFFTGWEAERMRAEVIERISASPALAVQATSFFPGE